MDQEQEKKPISEEGKLRLKEETTRSMREVAGLVDQARNAIRFIDQAESILQGDQKKNMGEQAPYERHHLLRLGEYTLVLGLIHLDMTSAFRIYLNASEPYDVIYATKQLLVTINEGYKQIYHYLSADESKQQESKRSQSYWVKDMGRLVDLELPDLRSDYQTITNALDVYDDQELKEMTKPRNLAIHYDNRASKVYDMLMKLDIETLAKKALPFMSILNDMVAFSLKAMVSYNALIQERADQTVSYHVDKLEAMKLAHPEAEDLFSKMQDFVKNFGATK
jgi:hypothetical protein